MINSKPNYSIEAYETSDNAREIYSSIRKRTITQRIDDRTFCLCQSIFQCNHCDHEEEPCNCQAIETVYGGCRGHSFTCDPHSSCSPQCSCDSN